MWIIESPHEKTAKWPDRCDVNCVCRLVDIQDFVDKKLLKKNKKKFKKVAKNCWHKVLKVLLYVGCRASDGEQMDIDNCIRAK